MNGLSRTCVIQSSDRPINSRSRTSEMTFVWAKCVSTTCRTTLLLSEAGKVLSNHTTKHGPSRWKHPLCWHVPKSSPVADCVSDGYEPHALPTLNEKINVSSILVQTRSPCSLCQQPHPTSCFVHGRTFKFSTVGADSPSPFPYLAADVYFPGVQAPRAKVALRKWGYASG